MTYKNIEEAYKKEFNQLVGAAKTHLFNADYAIDCVHNVFTRLVEQRHARSLKGYYLLRDVCREAEKINKQLMYINNNEESYDVQDGGGSVPEGDTEIAVNSQGTFE